MSRASLSTFDRRLEGLDFGTRNLHSFFWDGVTDYTKPQDGEKAGEEEEVRHEEFGSWLDNQELPPELQLQVEA